MGERRLGPNLERTERAMSKMGSGGCRGQRHGDRCWLPSSRGELTS